jgi:hypothetical protein
MARQIDAPIARSPNNDCDGLTAPCVIEGPINGASSHAYVEQLLVPGLAPGDIFVMDNLGKPQEPSRSRSDAGRQGQALFPASLLARLAPPWESPPIQPTQIAF